MRSCVARCCVLLQKSLYLVPTRANMSIDIGGMRHPYKNPKEVFLEDDLVSAEPFAQFKNWFDQACDTPAILEANAMCLATATKDGVPSARMVLLKSYSKEGFVFYTNYDSRKGRELVENPHASLCFYWEALMRSVRVEGKVHKISQEESERYFQSRPRSSQIGACVSEQSKVISSRDVLTNKQKCLEDKYSDVNVPIDRPNNWGGFLVVPRVIEFWQGQSNRIHDRILFKKISEYPEDELKSGVEGWGYCRLSP